MFSITASLPLIEGCFKDIGVDFAEESIYSQNGLDMPGQTFVIAFKHDGTTTDIDEVNQSKLSTSRPWWMFPLYSRWINSSDSLILLFIS